MNNKEKVAKLRQINRKDLIGRKLFDVFAKEPLWVDSVEINKIAEMANLDIRTVRTFFKEYLGSGTEKTSKNALHLGKYVKGAHGHPSRFHWFVNDPERYSMRQIGLAAKGLSEELSAEEDEELSDEEYSDSDLVAQASNLKREVALPGKRILTITFPKDISLEEVEEAFRRIKWELDL